MILGIETSCDETAAAVVTSRREILSSVVLSQFAEHKPYGGVVPEIAARAHTKALESVIEAALEKAGAGLADMEAVAVTAGPGLIGGVMVGVMAAKAICSVTKKPFIAVNHLEGHALTTRLTDGTEFPFLLLLVSGGHCQLVTVLGVGRYELLGETLDDAVGESFDKVAKMLGLGLPGGPKVEECAKGGDSARFSFPLPLKDRKTLDFSFSGLKTSVRTAVEKLGAAAEQDKKDICASFQRAVGEILRDRVSRAMVVYPHSNRTLVVAGGVAANLYLREILASLCAGNGFAFSSPPPSLCTDNAAMIAWAGAERLAMGLVSPLSFEPRARWELAA